MYVIWYVRVFLGVRGRSRRRGGGGVVVGAGLAHFAEGEAHHETSKFCAVGGGGGLRAIGPARSVAAAGRTVGRTWRGEGCARERRSVHSQPETPFRPLPLASSPSLPAAESDCAWRHSPPPPSSRLGLPCRRPPTNGPSLRPSSALFPFKLRALSVSVAVVVVGGAAVDLKNVQTAQQQSVCKEAPRSEEGLPRSLGLCLLCSCCSRCLFPAPWWLASQCKNGMQDLRLLLAEVHE